MNIFEKDFVVVPINENYHWYLVIICYPGMVGCKSYSEGTVCPTPASQSNRRRAKVKVKAIQQKMAARPLKVLLPTSVSPILYYILNLIQVQQWTVMLVTGLV